MTRWWMILVLGTLGGCDWLYPDDTDEPDESGDTDADCPSGWHASSGEALTINNFVVNGLLLAATFAPNTTIDGRASSCIADDGTAVDFVFLVDNQRYGRIELSDISGTGTKDPNGTAEQLRIELTGTDPDVTYVNGDWQSGTINVSSADDTLAFDLAGSAVRSGQSLNIQLSAEASQ